jgi:hypothetical protein
VARDFGWNTAAREYATLFEQMVSRWRVHADA